MRPGTGLALARQELQVKELEASRRRFWAALDEIRAVRSWKPFSLTFQRLAKIQIAQQDWSTCCSIAATLESSGVRGRDQCTAEANVTIWPPAKVSKDLARCKTASASLIRRAESMRLSADMDFIASLGDCRHRSRPRVTGRAPGPRA